MSLPRKTSSSARITILSAIVAVASVAVYVTALPNGFVVDDHHQIVANPWMESFGSLPEVFTTDVWSFEGRLSSYYRPLMYTFYIATYQSFGLQPWAFHAVNVLLHAAVSVLVLLIATRLLDRDGSGVSSAPSFMAALLFATHPIHTEAVAWIAGITDVSFALFYLLSFYLYIRAGDRTVFVLLSATSFLLAMLCKEPAVTLPLLLVLYDLIFEGRGAPAVSRLGKLIPYAVAGTLYIALRSNALGGMAPTAVELGLGPFRYALTVAALSSLYLQKLVLPVNLNFWYGFEPPVSALSVRGLLACGVVSAFVGIGFVAWRTSRTAFLGVLFTAVPLLPAFYLSGLNQGLENAFTERYLYLPSFGFVLVIAALVDRIRRRQPRWGTAAVAVLAVVALAYAGTTLRRNLVWKDSLSLWSDVIGKSPDSAVAHQNYGFALMAAGRVEEGRAHLRIARTIGPELVDSHVRKGIAFASRGLAKRAVLAFQAALALDPDSAEVQYNVAVAYEQIGWRDAAMRHYERALALRPDHADAHNNLAILYAGRGLMDRALPHFEAAARLEPDDLEFRANLQRARGH